MVTDLVRRVAESPFNDRLSRSIDWIVIGVVFLLLAEYELVQMSRRGSDWKSSTRTWVFVVPLAFAVVFIVAQRLKNAR
jgi:hypothetical protein